MQVMRLFSTFSLVLLSLFTLLHSLGSAFARIKLICGLQNSKRNDLPNKIFASNIWTSTGRAHTMFLRYTKELSRILLWKQHNNVHQAQVVGPFADLFINMLSADHQHKLVRHILYNFHPRFPFATSV